VVRAKIVVDDVRNFAPKRGFCAIDFPKRDVKSDIGLIWYKLS
jgi:hypothetical protein